nr:SLC13 family permease [Sporohalobacter salinus]
MIIVSTIVLLAVILFLLEPLRLDILALSIPVVLVLLQPWTKISTEEALSGFANKATITILAMFILSEGVQRSGLVRSLGDKIAQITTGSEMSQVGIITGLSGTIAGILNNTPLVAIFIPMVTNLARKTKTSPSKLLIPLSYASMMGGVMTLIGTSTNLLASDLSARLIDHPFSMFEFTPLGGVVLLVGIIYLVTIGWRLIPDRIDPQENLIDEYKMRDFLTEVVIEEDSPLVNKSVGETLNKTELDLDLVQIIRSGEQFVEPLAAKVFQAGDHLVIRTDQDTLLEVMNAEGLRLIPEIRITRKQLEEPIKGHKVVETVIPHGSFMEGQTLEKVNFLERYNSTVLAIRRGHELTHKLMSEITLKAGDVLLLLAGEKTLDRLRSNRNFIISREIDSTDYRRSKIPIALGILFTVIISAALGLTPIVVSALAGVIAMVATGCVKSSEIYKAINWEVIFLLAGLIPLGIAMEKTGTAQYIAQQVLEIAGFFPPVVTLGIFYLLTALLTNIISNNASVLLMIPIAVDAAQQIGASPFSFVLAVTFAASTAFLTPVGYQTNLMVYGPGGYRFRDFVVIGAPLQLLLTIITPIFIALIWGV